MKYDVIIVGAGPMGIYTAYEFMVKAPNAKVLLIDKGHDIYHRNCPILGKRAKQCPKDVFGKTGCKPACSMTSGFGGCGAFSDGKFNITSDFGGWMGHSPERQLTNSLSPIRRSTWLPKRLLWLVSMDIATVT